MGIEKVDIGPPIVEIRQEALTNSGYTPSGITRYTNTVSEYGYELNQRAIAYGEAEKAKGLKREVTHDHVRRAAKALGGVTRSQVSGWSVAGQIGEYVFTALAGVCGGQLLRKENGWWIVGFAVCICVALILLVTRLVNRRDH